MNRGADTFVQGLAIVLALFILVASVVAVVVEPATFAARSDQYESAVTETLLPLFAAVAAAIVGKAFAVALTRTKVSTPVPANVDMRQ